MSSNGQINPIDAQIMDIQRQILASLQQMQVLVNQRQPAGGSNLNIPFPTGMMPPNPTNDLNPTPTTSNSPTPTNSSPPTSTSTPTSTDHPSSPSKSTDSGHHGLSKGGIIGLSVGLGAAALILLAMLIFCLVKRRRNQQAPGGPPMRDLEEEYHGQASQPDYHGEMSQTGYQGEMSHPGYPPPPPRAMGQRNVPTGLHRSDSLDTKTSSSTLGYRVI